MRPKDAIKLFNENMSKKLPHQDLEDILYLTFDKICEIHEKELQDKFNEGYKQAVDGRYL